MCLFNFEWRNSLLFHWRENSCSL